MTAEPAAKSRQVRVAALLALVTAAACAGYLVGSWSYSFSSFMQLEDKLGASSDRLDELAATPPAVTIENWIVVGVMVISTGVALWCAVLVRRGGSRHPLAGRTPMIVAIVLAVIGVVATLVLAPVAGVLFIAASLAWCAIVAAGTAPQPTMHT